MDLILSIYIYTFINRDKDKVLGLGQSQLTACYNK